MNFELKILSVSRIKERNLLKPSERAMVKPDTGVEIKNKSAYYVIRDCATLAHDYIPHKCYSSLDDPIAALQGAFTMDDIEDFVNRCSNQSHTRQLLNIIFSDIYRKEAEQWKPPEPEAPQVLEIDADADGEDIYQDYGYSDAQDSTVTHVEIPVEAPMDLNDSDAVSVKLAQAFGLNV